jgi:hypothetical protein
LWDGFLGCDVLGCASGLGFLTGVLCWAFGCVYGLGFEAGVVWSGLLGWFCWWTVLVEWAGLLGWSGLVVCVELGPSCGLDWILDWAGLVLWDI